MMAKKRPMTIYDIPRIVKTALPNAFTPRNTVAGFQVTASPPLTGTFSETFCHPREPSLFSEPSHPTSKPDSSAVDCGVIAKAGLSAAQEGNGRPTLSVVMPVSLNATSPNQPCFPTPEEVTPFEIYRQRKKQQQTIKKYNFSNIDQHSAERDIATRTKSIQKQKRKHFKRGK